MRAILIDPEAKTITEVEHSGDYHEIYTLIGAERFDCVRLGDKEENTIYVDDEGLLKPNTFFRFDGDNPAYLAGRGLILATDEEGGSIGTKLSLESVRVRVQFGVPLRVSEHKIIFVADNNIHYNID